MAVARAPGNDKKKNYTHGYEKLLATAGSIWSGLCLSSPHLQFIRSCEPFAAVDPAAHEGPLAAVPAQVGAQVGRLAVHLVTAGDVTDVHTLLVRVRVNHFAVGRTE